MSNPLEKLTLQKLTLLGSTGSVGVQALEVIDRFPGRFRVQGLAAGNNLERLARQVKRFRPERVAIQSPDRVRELRELLKTEAPDFRGKILAGPEGLEALAGDPDTNTVLVALVGLTGLSPTLSALAAGKRVLTANKETFVAAGHLVAPWLDQVIPIDSEHSAIHQCLKGESCRAIRTLYLTASGGPFRQHSHEALDHVTVTEALKHPNWVMGRKISVDSATLMNKGLEVIEARWLFGVPYDRIRVVIHPQSIVHSGVEFIDGSILVQMGTADMRIPIAYALGYPERLPTAFEQSRLDLAGLSGLTFEPPDESRFPCLRLAYEAGRLNPGATAVLNAADEVAVELFLEERIPFTAIPFLVESALDRFRTQDPNPAPSLEEVLALDHWTRQMTREKSPAFA